MLRSWTSAGVIATALFMSAGADAQVGPDWTNLPYGDGHERHVLDIYLPAGEGPHPVVLWVHGGGWRSGDKSAAARRAPLILGAGFAIVSINYRYSWQERFPAQIHDSKAAVRWIRANAEGYGLDASFIGAWGTSAGAHLAELLGTSSGVADAEGSVGEHADESSAIDAVVAYAGPSDFFRVEGWHTDCEEGRQSAEELLFGACLGDIQRNVENPDWAEVVALARLASVTTHVSADDPPFHLAHGTADPTVWPEHSVLLAADLRAAGAEATLRLVEGAGHGLPESEDPIAVDFLLGVLERSRCPADVDGNGVLDGGDVLGFLAAFFGGDPRADFDGSGEVDGGDLLAFLDAFFGGCR